MIPSVAILTSLLVTFGLANQPPTPADDEGGGEATPASALAFPESESIVDAADEGKDGRSLLQKALAPLGLPELDKLRSLSFKRTSSNWRGERLAFWEKAETQARLEGTLVGRVDVPSEINPDNGRPLNTVFVENGDDKFMMLNRSVLATEANELQAARMLRNEVFTVLAPWLVLRDSPQIRIAGVAETETFSYDYSDETGPTNYQPESHRWVKLMAEMPAYYAIACGPVVEIWIDPETNEIRRLRYQMHGREGIYGENRISLDYLEWAEVGGIRFPARLSLHPMRDASLRELAVFSDYKINPGVDEQDLRRP